MWEYIQLSTNGEKVKRYAVNDSLKKSLKLWDGSHYYFIDETYLHYEKLFKETNISTLRIELEEYICQCLDNFQTPLYEKTSNEKIAASFKKFSSTIESEDFFFPQKRIFLTNGLPIDPEETNERNNYAEILINVFSELVSADSAKNTVSTIQKYFPYFMAYYLLNNSYSLKTNCSNEMDNEFNEKNFSLSKIKNNTKKKSSFIKRLMYYFPGGNASYLESYQTLCQRYYIEHSIGEDAFYTFWERNYYLIYIFSLCAECCLAVDLEYCDYEMSFVLFMNQLYSKNETITFKEFITLLSVFFFGALISSKKRKNYKKGSSFVQEMHYQPPNYLFANLLYTPTPFQLDKQDFLKYIHTMLANYSIFKSEPPFTLIPPEHFETLRKEAPHLCLPKFDIYEYYDYDISPTKMRFKRSIGDSKKYRIKNLHTKFKELSDEHEKLSAAIAATGIYFEFQNEPIPTDFSGSSIIRNIFVSYIINPSCEPAPPEGEFIFTEDALKKIYQDILSCE